MENNKLKIYGIFNMTKNQYLTFQVFSLAVLFVLYLLYDYFLNGTSWQNYLPAFFAIVTCVELMETRLVLMAFTNKIYSHFETETVKSSVVSEIFN